jgi:hypothetical protein
MSTNYSPAPTYVQIVTVDKEGEDWRFSPLWLRWFFDLGVLLTPLASPSAGAITISGSLQVLTAGGYKSSDGSAGITGTMTTASLVGKTLTFKDGLVVGFA